MSTPHVVTSRPGKRPWRPARARVAAAVALLAWLAGLLLFCGSALPLATAVHALAGSRFAGAPLGPGATLLLLAALAVAVFVPAGWLGVALWRPRAVVAAASHTHRAWLASLWRRPAGAATALLGCGVAWWLAALAGVAPWVPWLLPAVAGVLMGALACPLARPAGAGSSNLHSPPAGKARGPGLWHGRAARLLRALLWRGLALVAALAAIALLTAGLLLSPARMQVQPAPVAEGVDAALRARIGELNPLQLAAGRQAVVNLAPAEAQLLLQFVLRRVDAGARVRVHGEPPRATPGMGRGALAVQASVRLPWPSRRAFVNMSASIVASLGDGALVFDRCVLVVGAVTLPRGPCSALLGGWYATTAGQEGHTGLAAQGGALPRVGALDALQVDGEGAALVYRRLELPEATRRALQRVLGPGDDVVAAVNAQLLNLEQHAPRLQASGDRFRDALQLAFRMARLRSRVGDPVAENQGAILALALVFGHPDVALAAGLPRRPDVAHLAERIGPLHLWGRVDWGQHFLVSAAFAQVATASLSDVAGLLKEQLDADGGSGFAFTDLLADRAGTAFGRHLAADAAAAQHVQARIVDAWRLEDIAPSPAGLPEGLQADAFRASFGAVGSARYRAVEAEIERRLGTAALLR